ncbi:MAG: hypothetical protein GC192_23530 [Bacteroidetes bacterium]|nr:hypothetical protein [Bacteroidota bacterium]
MNTYLRGSDFAFNYFVENDDDTAFDMDYLNDCRVFLRVNGRQVAQYSLVEAEGFEDLVIGDEENELVIVADRDKTIDWPKGYLDARIELDVQDALFDDGERNPIEVEIGMLK